uniref:Receptor-like serine/threonine-protein kinase n=1 Tax=Quercus lobata TaxID=97700 RepID=A0A7N2LTX1_QUELO
MNPTKPFLNIVLLLLFSLVFPICISFETITQNQPLKDGQILVSYQKTFALGFFTPENSNRRYVGIWYNQIIELKTVVWVANRDNPLYDKSGVLSINGQGNPVLHTQNQSIPIWSTNVSTSASPTKNSMAKLSKEGNLLLQQDSQKVIWQSFDYPTDTMLPFMKLGLDLRTGLNRYLTSWKSKDDLGIGNYSYRIDTTGYPQLILYKGQTPLWRAGTWTGLRWSGVPKMIPNYVFNASYVSNQDEITIVYGLIDPKVFSKMVMDELGTLQLSTWHETRWVEYWSTPQETCDKYSGCGPNSYCDPYNGDKFECTCLPGLEPKSPGDWDLRDASGGCVSKQGMSTCNNGEGFVKLARVKVPDTSIARADMSLSLTYCEQQCLRNCSCMAYASANESEGGIGCLTWHGNLVDTRTYSDTGQDLYIRVDAVVLAQYAQKKGLTRKKRMLTILGVFVAVMFLLMILVVYWLVRRKKKDKRQNAYSNSVASNLPYFEDSPGRRDLDGTTRNSSSPLFDLRTIIAATDNFSVANKLGKGGFGLVYKASNVLLDNTLNPKISDFGMARIVGEDQIEANTNCVVGTYGYMSPEYAMQGLFSIKSDVYSFGVLLLEIIIGKKNSAYLHDGPSSNLIGHVWDLWREGNATNIVDLLLGETYPASEVSRCIQIGLLCVQEHAIDRPTMSTIVFMLGNDTPLPSPKQPAFILKGTYISTNRSTSEASNSVNEITISKLDGR